MYLLEIDPTHNRLHITLAGAFNESDAKALHEELKGNIAGLATDFHVLCDLTPLEEFDKAARPHYRAVMELCSHAGARKIVRIIPDPMNNFGITIMSNIHYDSQIPVINCKTLKEALKHL
ncbi:MAG: hypothetical protein K9M54_04535 [Kiritimatiellales bacterium]|nr:hypothetical protein [Kiritimatiellales bacterium]MCF7864598.1 hypothetical protein [Kiritimatiellales bacterium]